MSWIQNFFQRFIKNDVPEYDGYDVHREKQEKPFFLRANGGSKELNTRISYQYPKGRLHYLSIPEVPSTIEKPIRKKRQEFQTESKIVEKNPPHSRKQEPTKKKPVEPPKRKGPFHPTEIPSPVYGFKRPASKEPEVVEHELSHFINEENNSSMQIIPNQIEPVLEFQSITPIDSLDKINNLVTEEEVQLTEIEKTEIVTNEPNDIADNKEPAHNITLHHQLQSLLDTEEQLEEQVGDPVQTEQQVEPDQVELPKPKRSPLPFNVMMLKQDKLKWEENKKRRREQKENIVQQVSVQEEVPNITLQPKVNQMEESVTEPEPIVQVTEQEKNTVDGYIFPQADLLNPPVAVDNDSEWLHTQEELLNQTLLNFNVGAKVVNVTQGPSVTRFEVQPEPGVKVNKITNLTDDIKLSLAAKDIRIEAPIPGKHTIGIEVPNQNSRPVFINEIIQGSVFRDSVSPLTAVLGLDISGKPIVTDLKKMPHGLIAGATGSGKSVCINTILVSLLFKASPEDLKLLLIDPKMVELAPYNRIPHLVSPVITDVKAATAALKWAVEEMERRYELFAHTGVRDINRFNELAMKHKRYSDKLPFIVIIIDELADLMMMSPADVEEAICRIAQKARACGIHLIVATQRPSVDVITGLIKANIPTRIAFSVSSQVDSRTIIDISGAEKLLGRGDMLFLENGSSKPVRLQGTFVSDEEIDLVVEHVREQREPDYLFEQEELLKKSQINDEEDELFYEACEFIIEQGLASTSSLQRRFKIGYNRAARLMDMLETNGFITSANGSKPREVLISEADLVEMQDTGTMK
nr:DNA translocase FtsK [Neobacillus sp. Marseille-Q6967]